jgi:GH25 family lysozyme M1 (1,4-beta-N-acetylmuramidase)
MTEIFRESPELHDAHVDEFFPADARALPTPTTPGYTYFTDYKGRKWTCCTCVRDFLTYAQRVAIKRGLLKQGFDIWQLTGGAAASAGTHSQGGAFDLLLQTSDAWVKFFRDLGATATWRRTTAQGFSAVHLHGVLNGCVHNAPARYQVTEQKSGPPTGGGDGLTGTKPDYHPDPNPYRTWTQGVEAMKKELGLMALTTTSTVTLAPPEISKGSFSRVTGQTAQPGTAYAAGTHVYEYLPAGTTVWKAFHSTPVVNGKSSFYWNFGNDQPIRLRFIPSNATLSKASTSVAVRPAVVDVAALRAEVVTLRSQVTALTTERNRLSGENAALKAEIERLKAANPPEPVPALGVDVSGWQSIEQVRALVANPVNAFVIVKATQGLAFTSEKFDPYRLEAGAKYLGSYHYGEPPQNAVSEMMHYLATVGSGGLLAVDVEYFDHLNPSKTPLTAEQEKALAAYVLHSVRYLHESTGKKPLTYTNWLWLKPIRNGLTVAEWEEVVDIAPLWLAEVAPPGKHEPVDPKPGSTKPWPVWLHQYSYAVDETGEAIDRNYTPDIERLRALVI